MNVSQLEELYRRKPNWVRERIDSPFGKVVTFYGGTSYIRTVEGHNDDVFYYGPLTPEQLVAAKLLSVVEMVL